MYLSEFNATWATWCRRDGRRAVRRWHTTKHLEPVTVDRLTRRDRTLVDDPNFQRALLDVHSSGDDDAGLVVLWLLVPGLVNLRREDGPNSALDDGELFGLVWCHIARYDPQARAGLPVPNLLRDIRRDWIRAQRKARTHRSELSCARPDPDTPSDRLDEPVRRHDQTGPTVETQVVERLAMSERMAVLPTAVMGVVSLMATEPGLTHAGIGERLGISYRHVRRQITRARHHLDAA